MTLIDTVEGMFSPTPSAPSPVQDAQLLPEIEAALAASAPRTSSATWGGPLRTAFIRFELTTPKRIAAALGQFAVEAGDGYREVIENTNYTTPTRLVSIFPDEFDLATANQYAGNAVAIANRAYANKLGNGDEASGDGNLFKGRGLIQLTGRDEYAAFASAMNLSIEDAAAYCESPAGAAMSGCWYFVWRNLLQAMDDWKLSDVTRGVNGRAMLGNADRIAAANRALATFSA